MMLMVCGMVMIAFGLSGLVIARSVKAVKIALHELREAEIILRRMTAEARRVRLNATENRATRPSPRC